MICNLGMLLLLIAVFINTYRALCSVYVSNICLQQSFKFKRICVDYKNVCKYQVIE